MYAMDPVRNPGLNRIGPLPMHVVEGEYKLSEDIVVCRRQPNLNSNCQLVCVCVKSKVKVLVYR